MFWKVRRWGVEAVFGRGAIPVREMQIMELLGAVWDAVTKMRSLHGDDIHKMTSAEIDLVWWLREEGMLE